MFRYTLKRYTNPSTSSTGLPLCDLPTVNLWLKGCKLHARLSAPLENSDSVWICLGSVWICLDLFGLCLDLFGLCLEIVQYYSSNNLQKCQNNFCTRTYTHSNIMTYSCADQSENKKQTKKLKKQTKQKVWGAFPGEPKNKET